jgi:cytochrome c-type biogenesis protein CcmF
VSPAIQLVQTTQQRKPLAGVLSLPLEDLFVIYNGVNSDEELSLTAFINPCISFVWVGFGLLMVGTVIATVGRRRPKPKPQPQPQPQPAAEAGEKYAPVGDEGKPVASQPQPAAEAGEKGDV